MSSPINDDNSAQSGGLPPSSAPLPPINPDDLSLAPPSSKGAQYENLVKIGSQYGALLEERSHQADELKNDSIESANSPDDSNSLTSAIMQSLGSNNPDDLQNNFFNNILPNEPALPVIAALYKLYNQAILSGSSDRTQETLSRNASNNDAMQTDKNRQDNATLQNTTQAITGDSDKMMMRETVTNDDNATTATNAPNDDNVAAQTSSAATAEQTTAASTNDDNAAAAANVPNDDNVAAQTSSAATAEQTTAASSVDAAQGPAGSSLVSQAQKEGNPWLAGSSYVAFLQSFMQLVHTMILAKEAETIIQVSTMNMIVSLAQDASEAIKNSAKAQAWQHIWTAIGAGISAAASIVSLGASLSLNPKSYDSIPKNPEEQLNEPDNRLLNEKGQARADTAIVNENGELIGDVHAVETRSRAMSEAGLTERENNTLLQKGIRNREEEFGAARARDRDDPPPTPDERELSDIARKKLHARGYTDEEIDDPNMVGNNRPWSGEHGETDNDKLMDGRVSRYYLKKADPTSKEPAVWHDAKQGGLTEAEITRKNQQADNKFQYYRQSIDVSRSIASSGSEMVTNIMQAQLTMEGGAYDALKTMLDAYQQIAKQQLDTATQAFQSDSKMIDDTLNALKQLYDQLSQSVSQMLLR